MGSEFEDKGIEKYKATLELSDAIEVMNQYQKQKEEILRRQEEEAKRKAEEEARKASEVSSATDTPMQEAPVAQTVQEEKLLSRSRLMIQLFMRLLLIRSRSCSWKHRCAA